MQTISISEAKGELSKYLRLAEKETIIITRRGRPTAVLLGLGSKPIDLRERDIGEAQAANLRARLARFAEDWDSPEMQVYDDYDTAKISL